MKKITTLFAGILMFTACQAQSQLVTADNENIQYVGRIDYSNPKALKFGYTGTQIHTAFTGTSVAMKMKPNSGYYMVEIDKEKARKIQSKEDSVVVIAEGLKEGSHRLTITQCDEAVLVKFPVFYGLLLDEGATLSKVQLPTRKIEFIGNSITCALGVEDTSVKHNGPTLINQNAWLSYAAETARRLNAQYMLVSRSGIGVYRNNGGAKTGDKKVMPYYYPHSTFSDTSQQWDFKRYTPDVVCINLGTNDTSQEYIISMFTDAFTKFVESVHKRYPKAKIVLLSGTMRKGKRLADLTGALDETVKRLKDKGIDEVYRLDFTPADGSLGYGSGMHPSQRQHQKMADELTPLLKKIMNW